jgi:hypothetical protein
MADKALVEGAICDTMDLRRSVILSLLYMEKLMSEADRGDAQDVELDAECGDGCFNKLVGQPRRRWSRGSRTRRHEFQGSADRQLAVSSLLSFSRLHHMSKTLNSFNALVRLMAIV